ncbi:response regulator transcription factor [Candidatus Parcubacteria bacterium]|nr:response regulator transcription factor [Candidatus Parcubacteria bacterium]
MKKRILVIDDDITILQALQMTFEDEGYEVEASPNGKPVESINGYQPNVVLLDIMLAGEDGRKLAKKIRSKFPDKPTIIIISAMADAKESALKSGADHFVAKPFDLDHIVELADQACNGG